MYQAMRRLGVSRQTVLQRVKRGMIRPRKLASRGGSTVKSGFSSEEPVANLAFGPPPGIVAVLAQRCSFEASREFSHVDDNPGMRAGPDLLGAIGCSDGELDLPPVDFRHLGLRGDKASNGCRGEMAYVDGRADCALTAIR